MGFFDFVASVLTGGVSDIVQGKGPGSSIVSTLTDDATTNRLYDQITMSAATGGINDAYEAYQNGGNLYDFVDRAVDPGGSVDYSFRTGGSYLPEGVRSAAPSLGTLVGGIVGSYVPVIGTNEDNMQAAAVTYALAAASQAASEGLSTGAGANTPSPTDAGYELGGTTPVYNTTPITVDPALAPVEAGVTYPSVASSTYQIGGSTSAPSIPMNQGLALESSDPAYAWGGGVRPFQVDQSLDPNASPIDKGFDWQEALKVANKLAQLLGGSAGGQEFGTMTSTTGGTSVDPAMLSELMGRDQGKRGFIGSAEAKGPSLYETKVRQNKMGEYDPNQLYYS
jgi:hypothetical protein